MFVPRKTSSYSLNNSYAKLNPDRTGSVALLSGSFLTVSTSLGGCTISDIGKTSGKWYFEAKCVDASQKATLFGVVNLALYNKNSYPGAATNNGWCYYFYNGAKFLNDTSTAYAPTPAYNEWVGCYFDADAKTVGFISNGIDRGIAFTGLTGTLHAIFGNGSSARTGTQVINFGASPFAFDPPPNYNRGLY